MGEFSVSVDELFADGRIETEVCHLVHSRNVTNDYASPGGLL